MKNKNQVYEENLEDLIDHGKGKLIIKRIGIRVRIEYPSILIKFEILLIKKLSV